MGNDGGSIPTRRELVKEAARNPTTTELKATQTESQAHAWTHDPISHAPLAQPIVSDSNGRLYNKDSIIEFILPSEDTSEEAARAKEETEKTLKGAVKSLKDVVEIKFELDQPAVNGQAETWKCPITSSRLGPGSKAVYLVPCGHAFSGAAIKEVAKTAAGNKCLVCETEYAENDIIPILPTREEDIARLLLRAKTLKEKGLAHSLKKAAKDKTGKKRKQRTEDVTTTKAGEEVVPQLVEARNGVHTPKNGTATPTLPTTTTTAAGTADTNIRNTSTASLTAKVMAEQEKNKKRRMDNENLKTLFSSRDPAKPHGRSSDFMTRGFDIPAGARR